MALTHHCTKLLIYTTLKQNKKKTTWVFDIYILKFSIFFCTVVIYLMQMVKLFYCEIHPQKQLI